MNTLVEKLDEVQSNFKQELRGLLDRIKKCEQLGAKHTKELKLLDKKFDTELSKYSSKHEKNIPYIFDAPDKNPYFSGRSTELQDLQRILNLDNTGPEKQVCMGAVCGLGGIGKTSLVTEYAHRMKNYYKGGVYWFSAEDETFFEKSVNETALKLGASPLQTTNLTLTNTLVKIGQTNKPCLIVLDCLDQLDFSSSTRKLISLVSKQAISAALVMITRRNESKVVDDILSLRKDRCLTLKCLEMEEAKQFIFNRTGVTRDDDTNSVSKLIEELGGLPLALEQAGGCIKSLRCSLSDYLEQFRTERLKLLESKKATPVSLYESSERLAVHTTWQLNIKHIKESQHGIHAIRVMNAYAFFNPSEIEKELVNFGERPIEDKAFRDCLSSPLGRHQVVKLLTDFSLFMYVHAHSVSIHRLVQELIRENLDPEKKAKSFVDAVRLLSFAFSECSSPKQLLSNVGGEKRPKASNSQYFLWSKLCYHGFHLRHNMENFLANPNPKYLNSLFVFEIAKIFYECALHLSADKKQDEAKCTLNFAYRILDWIPGEEYDAIKNNLSNNFLFLSQVIPLPKWLQILIKECCVSPTRSLESLDQKPNVNDKDSESHDLKQKIIKLKSEGNEKFKHDHFKEAVDAYSAAIDKSRGTPAFDPLLLTNRASAYIKLSQSEHALKDANEYIARLPDCWKGYARKALVLDEKVSAEIAAALAYYYFYRNEGRCIFSEYKPFIRAFTGLKERISVCHTVQQLNAALQSFHEENCLPFIVLGSKEYILNIDTLVRNCIMIGVKSNATSVTVKLEGFSNLRLFNKCMFANLSFAIDHGQIIADNSSWVKILNCNFTSNSVSLSAVGSKGAFNAERCTFSNCKAGGLLCGGPGKMVVDRCSFCDNARAGLEVRERGKLTVRNSSIYNNCWYGLAIGPRASNCEVVDCQIYHNARGGITVAHDSEYVVLNRNKIYGNNRNGVFVIKSEVNIKENEVFDNEEWGIWAQDNSCCRVVMNDVFRNKCGGVCVEKERSNFVKLNASHDNIGPGYSEKDNQSNSHSFCESNVKYNNKELTVAKRSNFLSPWCSACSKRCQDLELCTTCLTAGYCNQDCQRKHRSKHKRLCNILREKSSFLIPSIVDDGPKDKISDNFHVKSLEDVGPDYAGPPPRNGEKFIVKVQNCCFEKNELETPARLGIYDQSLDVHGLFESQFINHLIKEFGVLCQCKVAEKKLFFYCVFEKTGKLRLFINDFADFQKW